MMLAPLEPGYRETDRQQRQHGETSEARLLRQQKLLFWHRRRCNNSDIA